MSKIFQIIADSGLGGAPKHVLTLTRHLNSKIFKPIIICPPGWLAKVAKKARIPVIELGFGGIGGWSAIKKLRQVFREQEPDIIHLHGPRAGWAGVLASRGLKTKVFYTEHLYTADYHLQSRWRETSQIWGLKVMINKADIIIAPSQAVKKFLVEKFQIEPEKIKVIPHGLEDYHARLVKPQLKIGFIGSLNHQKGVTDLIEAMKILQPSFPDLQLEIIGEGPLKHNLIKRAVPIKNNVKFLGPQEDIGKFISTWRAVIIPSLSESFGQVALEAAIAKKPVVASRVGALPEVVEDGATGILVVPKNPTIFAQAIQDLLEHPKRVEKMGELARQMYEKKFTVERMVNKTEKLYEQLIEEPK